MDVTLEEFNKKWEWQLVKPFPGMTIDEPDAIKCLDEEFTKLYKIFPSFRYTTIFKKAGEAIVNIHQILPEYIEPITQSLNKSLQ